MKILSYKELLEVCGGGGPGDNNGMHGALSGVVSDFTPLPAGKVGDPGITSAFVHGVQDSVRV